MSCKVETMHIQKLADQLPSCSVPKMEFNSLLSPTIYPQNKPFSCSSIDQKPSMEFLSQMMSPNDSYTYPRKPSSCAGGMNLSFGLPERYDLVDAFDRKPR
ncbi:hypothetical protein LOD99_3590 [Oopsacas minuta]|uniref:Uncharacterized protein n=1 Tax=Oopsacas minuta TaxID=111878 RepID=A0AAV7JX55_9METZ|nr:hypothetical protein LOD99_3590 [Oopsacas minuta]